jgi:mono/diheme cytochrome c family protein
VVLSSIPYRAEMLGRPRIRHKIGLFAVIGAILGLLAGVFLSAGTFLLYPLRVGGQPIVPVPPSLIILFETTMLGTMWATFLGFLLQNHLPTFRLQVYDPRVTDGHIGVAVQVGESLAEQAEQILKSYGAHHFTRVTVQPGPDGRFRVFWAAVAALLVVITLAVVLPAYGIIRIPFPTNMDNQAVVAYDQGPRLAAPAGAVPVQGPSLVGDQPASTPAPATTRSAEQGAALYADHCAMCHGRGGNGDGPLSGFFSPRPASLAGGPVRNFTDAEIFVVITRGRRAMPSLSENLSPSERWDVIRYVRSLQK